MMERKTFTFTKEMNVDVERVMVFKGYTAFSLVMDGLILPMRLVNAKGKTFITPNQHKGKDDKWYNDFYLYLDDKATNRIIQMVEEKLDAKTPAPSEDVPF